MRSAIPLLIGGLGGSHEKYIQLCMHHISRTSHTKTIAVGQYVFYVIVRYTRDLVAWC